VKNELVEGTSYGERYYILTITTADLRHERRLRSTSTGWYHALGYFITFLLHYYTVSILIHYYFITILNYYHRIYYNYTICHYFGAKAKLALRHTTVKRHRTGVGIKNIVILFYKIILYTIILCTYLHFVRI